jgi:hypothetical protein
MIQTPSVQMLGVFVFMAHGQSLPHPPPASGRQFREYAELGSTLHLPHHTHWRAA